MYAILIALISLSASAITVDEELKPYVGLFMELHKVKLTFDVKFGHLGKKEGTWAGYCQYNKAGKPIHIKLSKAWWDRNPSMYRRLNLVFHEMAHCALSIEHIYGFHRKSYACPKSIVLYRIFSEDEIERCLKPNLQYYLTNLEGK